MKSLSFESIASLTRNIIRLGGMVRRVEPTYFYGGALLQLLITAIPFVSGWLFALFLNKVAQGGVHTITDPTIVWIIAGYVVLPIIQVQLNTTFTHLNNQFYVRFGQYRDNLLIEKRANIDIQTFEGSEFNNLNSKVNDNMFRMIEFTNQITQLFSTTIGLVIAAAILMSYNFLLALLLIVALIPQLIVQLRYGKRTWGIWTARAEIRRKYIEYRRPFGDIPGLIEMRVFNTKEHFMHAIRSVVGIFNDELQSSERSRYLWLTAANGVGYTVSAICVVWLIHDTVGGILAIGTFTFVVGRIGDVRGNMFGFVQILATLFTDNLFVTDIFAYLDTPRALTDGTREVPKGTPVIVFDNVSFAYPGSAISVLHAINLTIHKGEKIAIVGVNGAGKTTFTKLLMRFYDPTGGSITVDGSPLHEATLASWYSHIGYLPQDYAKYRLPVREAIAIGNPTIPVDDALVREAARRSGADEFIAQWPQGYDTPLGRDFDGKEPSIGQWQKLALARVFYKNPDIWILDEPTSSIDAVAELEVFNELEQLPKDKTVVLISHRFNTVKNADKIVVIEQGTIVEMGSHDELMRNAGTYHRLFTSQKQSYEEESTNS